MAILSPELGSWRELVVVKTASAHDSDNVGVSIQSPLLNSGKPGVFLDFPWNDGSAKFSAPFVGSWNATANHTTTLNARTTGDVQAEIAHNLAAATFFTSVGGDAFSISKDPPSLHRYTLRPKTAKESTLSLTVAFGQEHESSILTPQDVFQSSKENWEAYWTGRAFVDCRHRLDGPESE